jgi:ATP-dependent DNA ligase
VPRVEKSAAQHHFTPVRFVPPCIPVLASEPPTGPNWLHEVKFDGWRVQAHKQGERVNLYSRNGRDLADRFTSQSSSGSVADAPRLELDPRG